MLFSNICSQYLNFGCELKLPRLLITRGGWLNSKAQGSEMKGIIARKRPLLVALLLASLFLTGCADDQARTQIANVDARVAQLDQSVGVIGDKVSNQKMLDIINKIDDLQSQIDQINGNIASMQHNQQAFQDTQSQLNQSIEQQLQSLGAAPVAVPANSGASAPVGVVNNDKQQVSSDKAQLNSSLKKIKAHNFNDAIKELKSLMSTSQNPDVIASASYYLAVAYAANGQYKNSMWVARKFVDANPNSPYAPDALFTIYISQQQLGMKKSAANTAALLKRNYPNSSAAKKVH